MRKRLTNFYDNYKIKKNKKIKMNKFLFSCVIFILIISIIMIIIFPKHRENWAEENEIYFVVADSNISNNNINSVSENVESFGGSGIVCDFKDNKNSVIIFAYYSLDDAEKILGGVQRIFQNASVISKKTDKLDKNLQTKIQNSQNLINAINYVYNEKYKAHEVVLNYENGNLSFNELYKFAYNSKTKINQIISKLSNDEYEIKVKNIYEQLCEFIDAFLSNNIKSEYSSLYFKKYVISLILSEIEIKSDIL